MHLPKIILSVLVPVILIAIFLWPKDIGHYGMVDGKKRSCFGVEYSVPDSGLKCLCGDYKCIGIPYGMETMTDEAINNKCKMFVSMSEMDFYKDGYGFADIHVNEICMPENYAKLAPGRSIILKAKIMNLGNKARPYTFEISQNETNRKNGIHIDAPDIKSIEPEDSVIIPIKISSEKTDLPGDYVFYLSDHPSNSSKAIYLRII